MAKILENTIVAAQIIGPYARLIRTLDYAET